MSENNKIERKYLDTNMAAEYLGFSPRTLINYRYNNKGPNYKKVNGKRLYTIEDLEAWVNGENVKAHDEKQKETEKMKDFRKQSFSQSVRKIFK